MSLASGTMLGPYVVTMRLAAGGMGEVYEARDTRLDRRVAIKVLPDQLADDPQLRLRFEREARSVSRLNHPCVCMLYDVGQHERTSYLVMELVEGETLRSRLHRSARLEVAEVVRIGLQCAQALAAAHEGGVVHRDIKPENVIVRQDGSVKVLDFGIAKLIDNVAVTALANAEVAADHTQTGMVLGTTAYMSPEQARGTAVDARSDVFSLGVLLYELLDGQAPFGGATPTDVLVAILQHEPPPLTRLRPDVDAELSNVIATCLAKDPARRYASGKPLAAALQAVGKKQDEPPAGPPSIAVLPFVNSSPDPENEYFCDGIAEDLMNGLTKVRELRVAARMSSFAFKGRQMDLRELGRLLNVRTILEGSVRKSGDRLRVSAELVNVADGFRLWSERYDRTIKDVFAIQDEISTAIVVALKGTLLGEDRAALLKRRTDNVEAFELYARGRHHWHKWTAEGLAEAQACMERAIALDPKYALAYVGLADCFLAAQAAGLAAPRAVLPNARIELSRALALDPNLDMAWALLGVAHFSSWDTDAAHGAVARALELNPFLGHAHSARGSTFWFQGELAAAAESALRSVELEPVAPVFRFLLILYLIALRDLDAAVSHAQFMLEVDKNGWQGHYALGLVQYAREQYAAATASFEAAVGHSGGSPIARSGLVCALAHAGQRPRAANEHETLLAARANGYVPAVNVAAACVGLGLADSAFEWLEKAIEEMDTWVTTAWWNPLFVDLRQDPRMLDLMRRFGPLHEAAAIGRQ